MTVTLLVNVLQSIQQCSMNKIGGQALVQGQTLILHPPAAYTWDRWADGATEVGPESWQGKCVQQQDKAVPIVLWG